MKYEYDFKPTLSKEEFEKLNPIKITIVPPSMVDETERLTGKRLDLINTENMDGVKLFETED